MDKAKETLAQLGQQIHELVGVYPDFPKPNILFRDILPIFEHPKLLDELCRAIADYSKVVGVVEAVAGLEARGFLFGPQVAIYLGVPFIPIRKFGKIPGAKYSQNYIKEYGEDIIEIQADVIGAGKRVLILDDLLATGGTLKGAYQLFTEQANAIVAQILVLIELDGLKGRETIPKNIPIFSLLHYDF